MGCGGGGGGCGQVAGLVVAVAATVFTAGAASPFITAALGEGLGASIATGALAGAAGGFAGSIVSGGDPWQGALRGGVGGAIGGGLFGPGGAFNSGAASGTPTTAGLSEATSSGDYVQAIQDSAGAGAAPNGAISGGGEMAVGGDTLGGGGSMAVTGESGPVLSQTGAGAQTQFAGLDTAGLEGPMQGGGNLSQYNNFDAGLQGPTPSGYAVDQVAGMQGPTPNGTALDVAMQQGGNTGGYTMADRMSNFGNQLVQAGKDTIAGAADPKNLAKAGLQLGIQGLAGAMTPKPDLGAMNSYLNDVKGMQMQANQFNIDNASKKAAIGDQMVQTAQNYNPEYTALQSQNQSKNRRSAQWADTESAMRAQGYDQSYINAMKSKFDLDTSTAAGTAYDSGWQTGQGLRNSTYQAAGGMYGQVQAPSAGMMDAYSSMYDMAGKSKDGLAKTLSESAGVQPTDTQQQKKLQNQAAN